LPILIAPSIVRLRKPGHAGSDPYPLDHDAPPAEPMAACDPLETGDARWFMPFCGVKVAIMEDSDRGRAMSGMREGAFHRKFLPRSAFGVTAKSGCLILRPCDFAASQQETPRTG